MTDSPPASTPPASSPSASSSPPPLSLRWPGGRSLGLKLLLVCGLALLMTIPAMFVWGLVLERSNRADSVVAEVSALAGGRRAFIGPVLAAPYERVNEFGEIVEAGWYAVSAGTGAAQAQVRAEVLRRSLYRVPAYQADVIFTARFETPDGLTGPGGAAIDWSRAVIAVAPGDPRGARETPVLRVNGGDARAFAPADLAGQRVMRNGERQRWQGAAGLTWIAAPVGGAASPGAVFDVEARLLFAGAGRLAFAPFARETTLEMQADWPHPSFEGGFVPVERDIGEDGFTARWSAPFIARGVAAEAPLESLGFDALLNRDFAVRFVNQTSPYQYLNRSLKYALLFVGLVFLTYFMFEVTSGRRAHPAQYVLAGLAQAVFYLLLLSLAERTGFDIAFVIAAAAVVAQTALFAGAVFRDRRYALRAGAALAGVYALLYVLMRLEDFALLVGAAASFAALALVMWVTRDVDWYGGKADAAS